uniref:5-hydroxytryptamine receptor 3A-like n=2 Tax=Oryzias latipes TaxID=8090 RepID=A0A3B3HT10_ORYLA
MMKSFKLQVLLITLLMYAPSSVAVLNCTGSDVPSLVNALQPVFNLSSIRPVTNASNPVTVDLIFTLTAILGVDEKSQVLKTYIWRELTWKNEFSVWDPDKCGTEWIAVPRTLLWEPDIVINEFMEKNTAPPVPYIYLHFDGDIYDSQPIRVVSSCSLDIYLFPFDIQNCTFTFNSYIHVMDEIQLLLSGTGDEMTEASKMVISTMGEWSLNKITANRAEIDTVEGNIYVELQCHISIRRHPTTYVVNLLLPSCFLIAVDLFSFMLPPKKIDRSLFKMTLVLGYTVFLLNTNQMLPITGDTVPLINVFLSMCLVMMVATLVESIFVTNLLHGSADYPPAPRWFRDFVFQVLGRLVRISTKSIERDNTVIQNPNAQEMSDSSPVVTKNDISEEKETLNENKSVQVLRKINRDLKAIHLQVEKKLKRNLSSQEWIYIALIIDRLLFFFYILFISVSFITILIIWVVSYSKA